MYRESNKACLNCGGDTSVPDINVFPRGNTYEVACSSCGYQLMKFVVAKGNRVHLSERACQDVNVRALNEILSVGPAGNFKTADFWWSAHDYEGFIHGVPIRRTLPDEFYAFRERALQEESIYG